MGSAQSVRRLRAGRGGGRSRPAPTQTKKWLGLALLGRGSRVAPPPDPTGSRGRQGVRRDAGEAVRCSDEALGRRWRGASDGDRRIWAWGAGSGGSRLEPAKARPKASFVAGEDPCGREGEREREDQGE